MGDHTVAVGVPANSRTVVGVSSVDSVPAFAGLPSAADDRDVSIVSACQPDCCQYSKIVPDVFTIAGLPAIAGVLCVVGFHAAAFIPAVACVPAVAVGPCYC